MNEWKHIPNWHTFPGSLSFSFFGFFPEQALHCLPRTFTDTSGSWVTESLRWGLSGQHDGCSASCSGLQGSPERIFLYKETVTQYYNNPNKWFLPDCAALRNTPTPRPTTNIFVNSKPIDLLRQTQTTVCLNLSRIISSNILKIYSLLLTFTDVSGSWVTEILRPGLHASTFHI